MRRRRLAFDPDPLGLTDSELTSVPMPNEAPTLSFRVLRPDDLVWLDVRCYRCALLESDQQGEAPTIAPSDEGAWLEVHFSFQHLGEQAWYRVGQDAAKVTDPVVNPGEDPETPPLNEPPSGSEIPDLPPVLARAANGSRLCFDVPAEARIEFSIAGILTALSRLPLRVSPWATPRPRPAVSGIELTGIVSELPGGLALARSDVGLALIRAARARRELGAETLAPEPASAARSIIGAVSELRLLRNVASREAAVDLARIGLMPAGAGERSGPETVELPIQWADLIGELGGIRRPRDGAPYPPSPHETAIEAPYRLIISPSNLGGFAHATRPVAPKGDPTRVELWHTRLGVRVADRGAARVEIDERASGQRIVRAIWARDLDPRADGDIYQHTDTMSGDQLLEPFRMSLDSRDRGMLVRQTADQTLATPQPVDAQRLYLSTLGAWLDLHADWSAAEVRPYVTEGRPGVLAWDHVAPLGRDQYVRVVYPGYLFPFGHACALVKVTERKILPEVDPAGWPQARLFQRKFLVVSEPVRTYEQLDMPFKEIRVIPLTTPDIDDPVKATTPHTGRPIVQSGDHLFWPVVGGEKFRFTLDCLDHAGDRVRLHAPLLFVAAHLGTAGQKAPIKGLYAADSQILAAGQPASIAKPVVPGDTTVEATSFTFQGEPGDPGSLTSRPKLERAEVVVPAMHHLAPAAPPISIVYPQAYLDNGFNGANPGQVFAAVIGAGAKVVYDDTSESGGLVAPNLVVEGLSRELGPVGDVASITQGDFDPQQFLAGLGDLMPKLFGIVDLVDLLEQAGLAEAPRFITEMLDVPVALIADLERLRGSLSTTVERLEAAAQEPGADPALAPAAAKLKQIRNTVEPAAKAVLDFVKPLLELETPSSLDDIEAALKQPLQKIAGKFAELETTVRQGPLPPTLKAELERLVAGLKPLLLKAADLQKSLELLTAMVNGIVSGNPAVRARYEWKPKLKTWPEVSRSLPVAEQKEKAVIYVPEYGFSLTIEARASAQGDAGVDALAELRDLSLNLLPDFPMMELGFDRIAFRGSSGRKPEVDVLFRGIEFKGILKFVQALSEVIPFDGLSDPPYVEVSASDARAGFDLAIPNLAVGIFSLENISFGLEGRVPFLGEAVTVGFNFCTRERPFVLTVMMFGGGGFVGLQASPKGLVLAEGALEFGARVALDFGVASGSIEAMGGIYYRQEDNSFTLSGYFRLRGEVRLLGIASVSLTCELSLTYRNKGGGKDELYGQAKVTLEVEVAFIEYSASFKVERRFAGSAGDPPLRAAIDLSANGNSKAWSEYCLAFAGD